MARKASFDKQSEEEDSDKSSSSDGKIGGSEEITKYEKQRLSRIKENRARMEALGMVSLSSSLFKGKGKKEEKKRNVGVKTRKGDDDYRPSSEEEEEDTSDDEFVSENDESSRSRRASIRKGKNVNSFHTLKTMKNKLVQKHVEESGAIDDDVALQKALALSLGGLADDPDVAATSGLSERKDGPCVQEATGRKKRRKEKNCSRVQLTEDDVIRYFFSFDEAGKGKITVRDLVRVATAHDFIWTEEETREMIYIFSSDGDGKLSLDDFRSIVSRCNMIRSAKNGE